MKTNFEKAFEHLSSESKENKQFGVYFVENGTLNVKRVINIEHAKKYLNPNHELKLVVEKLAIKTNGRILGNSSMLKNLLAKRNPWGDVTTDEQRLLSEKVPMIPFSAIESAKLDVRKIKVIDETPAETIVRTVTNGQDPKTYKTRYKDVDVHFTGAKLFQIGERQFLFDIDRNEIEHKIFNPFLVELKHSVKTVKDAYEALKPQLVKDAEAKGVEVKRQGEWFFIPKKLSKTFVKENHKKVVTNEWSVKQGNKPIMEFVPMTLRAGNNRPNRVDAGFTVGSLHYVKGVAKHDGREHKDLELAGWHIAIPNTSISSWTITGDID
jgi:hypothetical protein